MKSVNVLGTNYKIEYLKSTEDPNIGNGADGYCDWTDKRIVLQNAEEAGGNLGSMDFYWKKVLRHEIVHAFLFESGLAESSFSTDAWAKNEEMIDWIAFMGPKIVAAWQKAGCME